MELVAASGCLIRVACTLTWGAISAKTSMDWMLIPSPCCVDLCGWHNLSEVYCLGLVMIGPSAQQ